MVNFFLICFKNEKNKAKQEKAMQKTTLEIKKKKGYKIILNFW